MGLLKQYTKDYLLGGLLFLYECLNIIYCLILNLDFLSQYFTEVRFAKGELLTREAEVENYLYYLSEGIVRIFQLEDKPHHH